MSRVSICRDCGDWLELDETRRCEGCALKYTKKNTK